MSRRQALFLDRDGVINTDRGYVLAEKDFEFVDGVFDLCRAARDLGYLIVVVTNQAAIGRGYLTEQRFRELNDWMCRRFRAEGVEIERVYYSPTHPEYGVGPYRVDSPLRKPGPGMILRARDELGIDLQQSVLIGDKATDIQAGISAGIGCNLLFAGKAGEAVDRGKALAAIATLGEAVPFLRTKAGTADASP